MINEVIAPKFRIVFETAFIFSETFRGLSKEFRNDHDQYSIWLKEKIVECIKKDVFFGGLSELEIDWLTIHYRTRHPVQEWSKNRAWLQSAFPISEPMRKYGKDLRVYEKGESPYITYFAQEIPGRRLPLQILFHEGDSLIKQKGWLCINESFTELMKKKTEGNTAQEDFTQEEVEECEAVSSDIVENIKGTFITLSGQEISKAKTLGWLRNSCRVTFLALKKEDPDIKLPRMVILAPVYVEGENIVGGIAFVGSRELDDIETSILRTFADSLLSNIRLREEGLRESMVSYLEELSNARAEFVQRLSHSIQNPARAWI